MAQGRVTSSWLRRVMSATIQQDVWTTTRCVFGAAPVVSLHLDLIDEGSTSSLDSPLPPCATRRESRPPRTSEKTVSQPQHEPMPLRGGLPVEMVWVFLGRSAPRN